MLSDNKSYAHLDHVARQRISVGGSGALMRRWASYGRDHQGQSRSQLHTPFRWYSISKSDAY